MKVGEIELKVGYSMRVTRRPIDGTDFEERQLATECEDGEQVIEILDREM